MRYIFAIRDRFDGAIHSARYSCLDDAMSAAGRFCKKMRLRVK